MHINLFREEKKREQENREILKLNLFKERRVDGTSMLGFKEKRGMNVTNLQNVRLNLSRSWHKGHSHAYNTSFFI